ncbi:MAG: hypothetical protein FWF44_05105 [Defluviitaleaceae bacterium]|nr:hypothetical protein [Defluviitaleaceae bacterium]
MSFKAMPTPELVNLLCDMDRRKGNLAAQIQEAQAELQTRGLAILDDRNVKTTEFYGEGSNYAAVTLAQKMEILNYGRLELLLGGLVREKVAREEEVSYTVNPTFKRALIALFTGDYEKDTPLPYLLKTSFPELSSKQVDLLVKKLKGDYAKDKATLAAVVGGADIETELYMIGKVKNYELVRAFFDENELGRIAGELKKCLLVDETPKITVKYDESAGV